MTHRYCSRRFRLTLLVCASAATVPALASEINYDDIESEAHHYWTRPLHDPFTRLKADFESGRLKVDHRNERDSVISLLDILEIPVSSQMLVFSTTSLQLSRISTRNPRALYFNEDIYLGYVPGGRIEIISLDPELGGIFYIFDVPAGSDRFPRIERSRRCMNCHAGSETGYIPGLVIESVVPGPNRGTLDAFRRDVTGHGIPFHQRFGGWHVTGKPNIGKHWGNLVGRLSKGVLSTTRVEPGKRYDPSRYPAATSDILPLLLLEHQAGFVNRVLEASYRARTYVHAGKGRLTSEQERELDRQADIITRYLLFAEEVPLPAGGITGDADYEKAFLASRKTASGGLSLKDLDLRTRLFRHRCSYMIYSGVFRGLPPVMKNRIYRRIKCALGEDSSGDGFAFLPAEEKKAIRTILGETLTDLPKDW